MKLIQSTVFIVFALFADLSCADRFPSFDSLNKAEMVDLNDEDSIKEALEEFRKLQFTQQEIQRFYQSNQWEDLFIVYNQAMYGDPLRLQALEKALKLYPNTSLVLFQAVNHCAYIEASGDKKICSQKIYENFIRLNNNNMLAHYAIAGYFFTEGDIARSLEFLKSGNRAPIYDGFTKESFLIIKNKCMSMGFPEYIANRLAFTSFVSIMYLRPVIELCKSQYPRDNKSLAENCLLMGKRIEDYSSTVLEKAFGLSIQKHSVQAHGLSKPLVVDLEERRKKFDELSELVSEIPPESVTLKISNQFYSDLLQFGELKAYELFIKNTKAGKLNKTD